MRGSGGAVGIGLTWIKLDDQFFTNTKIADIGKDGRLLYLAGLCYASANLTDGRIKKAVLAVVAAMAGVSPKTAGALIAVGLWDDHGDHYEVHDYLAHQRSKADVEREKRAARERKSAFDERKRNGRSNAVTPSVPNGVSNGVSNGGGAPVDTEAETEVITSPSRLTPSIDPSGGGGIMGKAARLLAEAEAARRGSEIGNPDGYIKSRVRPIYQHYESVWRSMLMADPTLTAEDLTKGERGTTAVEMEEFRQRSNVEIEHTLAQFEYVPPEERAPIPLRPKNLIK